MKKPNAVPYFWAAALIAVAILLIGWELWVRLTHQPRYIMVPFSDVISACWDGRGQLLHHTWVTTVESVYGFVLAAAIGIPLAFGIVSLRPVQKGIFPLIVVYHVIPTIAIALMVQHATTQTSGRPMRAAGRLARFIARHSGIRLGAELVVRSGLRGSCAGRQGPGQGHGLSA